jgi:hypothetical protein
LEAWITGTTEEGRVLTAHSSSLPWRPAPSVSYQWQLCGGEEEGEVLGGECEDIEGATGATYTIPGEDDEYTLRVVANATNGRESRMAVSEASATVEEGQGGAEYELELADEQEYSPAFASPFTQLQPFESKASPVLGAFQLLVLRRWQDRRWSTRRGLDLLDGCGTQNGRPTWQFDHTPDRVPRRTSDPA